MKYILVCNTTSDMQYHYICMYARSLLESDTLKLYVIHYVCVMPLFLYNTITYMQYHHLHAKPSSACPFQSMQYDGIVYECNANL